MIRCLPRRVHFALLALCGILVLASCGNDPVRNNNNLALQSLTTWVLPGLDGDSAAGQAASTPESVAVVLQQLPGSLIRIELPKLSQSAIIQVAQRKGANVTWYTATGQTLTMNGGVIIATRGFGFDIMSSDFLDSVPIIRRKGSGTVTRTYWFLDDQDKEVPFEARCEIASEGGERIVLLSGKAASTTRMRETCTHGPFTFNNFYWVTGSGTVMKSRQWISREIGELEYELLRG